MARHRTRHLFAIDNLDALGRIATDSVRLAYIDPPFNSGRTYDAILGPRSVRHHRTEAFADAWSWSEEASDTARRLKDLVPSKVLNLLRGFRKTLGQTGTMAYLLMMAPRLSEVHRVLAEDGSLYVHCDPAASHYLRVLIDQLFGAENFRNEVVWKRTHAHSGSRRFGPIHDTILFYSKGPRYIWNPVYSDYTASYLQQYFRNEDEQGKFQLITCTAPGDRTGTRAHYEWRGKLPPPGRHWAWKSEAMEEYERAGRLVYSSNGIPRLKRYTDEGPGVALQDIWMDINRLDAHSAERVGYDTQKPLALLSRIIAASSDPDDVVLDPFCGSGTAAVAAERLGRQWIAIDSSLMACAITLARVRQEAHLGAVEITGFPADARTARQLLSNEPGAFGLWATSLLATVPDRQSSTEVMATGCGTIRAKSRHVDLLSWVPLRSRLGPSVAARSPGRRLSKLGFLLCHSRGHLEIGTSLSARLGVPIHPIALESLVEHGSLQSGLAPDVRRIVNTA